MPADYTLAKKEAQDIIKKYQIEDTAASHIFQIAREEGLTIKMLPMPEKYKNVSGFLDPSLKTIYINEIDPPNRIVFTIAHELGHFKMHKDRANELSVLLRNTSIATTDIEKEANCFAAELLVPENKLIEAINNPNFKNVEVLAKIFGVSQEVIVNRINRILK